MRVQAEGKGYGATFAKVPADAPIEAPDAVGASRLPFDDRQVALEELP